MRQLRNSPKALEQARIYTAGEKEYYDAQRVREKGVEIVPGVQKSLKTPCQELSISVDDLGF